MRKRFSILFVFVLVLTAVPSSAAATTMGTLFIEWDTSLTEDHHGRIVIVADNVTLDCGPHLILGSGEEESVGIALGGRTGVTVKNCDVSGFWYGIQLWESSGNTLDGNVSHHNEIDGFSLVSSLGNRLRGNTSHDNGVGFAVAGASTTGNTLVGNSAENNNSFGFFVFEASGNTLKGNYAEGNGDGYQLNLASNNTLKDNLAVDNGAGFVLYESSWNTLKDNVADGGGAFYFGDLTVVDNVLKGNMGCFSNVNQFESTNTFKSNDFSCSA